MQFFFPPESNALTTQFDTTLAYRHKPCPKFTTAKSAHPKLCRSESRGRFQFLREKCLAQIIPRNRRCHSGILLCDERLKSQVTGMDVERTSIPRIRRGIGDGLGCCYVAPRETALSELVARSRVCSFCGDRRGVDCLRRNQRGAILIGGTCHAAPSQDVL
jgi:hypothetical protein